MSAARLLLVEHNTPTSRPTDKNTLRFERMDETILVSAYILWDANDGDWDSYGANVPIADLCAAIDQVLAHTVPQKKSFVVKTKKYLSTGFCGQDSVTFNRMGNDLTVDILENGNGSHNMPFPLNKLHLLKGALEQARAA